MKEFVIALCILVSLILAVVLTIRHCTDGFSDQIITATTGRVFSAPWDKENSHLEYDVQVYEMGARAQHLHVPAEANPYIKCESDSVLWLEGWMDAEALDRSIENWRELTRQ